MLKNGTLVMLVRGDGFMPPLGSIGEVIGYDDGDYEVLFPRHSCPVPPGIFWYAEPAWLVPLDGGLLAEEVEREHAL